MITGPAVTKMHVANSILLGVTTEALAAACFRGRAAGAAGALAAAAARIDRYSISNRTLDGQDALKTFVAALYQVRIFDGLLKKH